MQRGFLIFLLSLIIGGYVVSCAFGKSIDDEIYNSTFTKKELLKDLSFAERQIFDATFEKKDMTERLEHLEIEVFGALQDGDEKIRIKKLKQAVTNVASGGMGLNNLSKIINLAGNSMGNSSWAIGNMHNFSPYSADSYRGHNYYSRMMPPPLRAGRYKNGYYPPPPPPNYSYTPTHNPITNGNFSKNYSIGTNVKILDD